MICENYKSKLQNDAAQQFVENGSLAFELDGMERCKLSGVTPSKIRTSPHRPIQNSEIVVDILLRRAVNRKSSHWKEN